HRRAAAERPLDDRPRQAEADVRRDPEDSGRRPSLHLALPAEQRSSDAEQHRRLRAVPGGILAVGAGDVDQVARPPSLAPNETLSARASLPRRRRTAAMY